LEGRADEGNWSGSVEVGKALAKRTLQSLNEPVDLGIGIAVAPPGHAAAATMLPKYDVRKALRSALLGARNGGVRFGQDDVQPGRPRGAAVISGAADLKFIGTAETLAEVDWITIAEDAKEASGHKTCIYEKGGVGLLRFYDANVVVFERRTGTRVASTLIHKRPVCPASALVDTKERWGRSSVPNDEIAAWTTRRLREVVAD
jgi:hypothetical protein